MILPLHIRHDPACDAQAAAWFLPGNAADRWLEELSRCGLAILETRLFLVPRSLNDRTPAGVLVVPSTTARPSKTPAGMPCQLIAERLFIPADAALEPPVAESELRRLSMLPVLFFHPVLGLSGFEVESTLRVNDFLERPADLQSSWNAARPGAQALPNLSIVIISEPPSFDTIFGEAEDEIGSDPHAELPPAPDEPKQTPLSRGRRGLRRIVATGISRVMNHVPESASQRTWINDLEDWAKRQLQAVSDDLDRLRSKELHRLLRLLETDPEAGLRHAIPLNNFAHRGKVPPGAQLGPRSLQFDPNRIGGKPTDTWSVPHDLHELLRRRYREMANREMQLGRYRRAAYIFAELLSDLPSAANAFKQGRLFREAALLYQEHLRNPLEAARCLAEGGLLLEAIERYENLGRWMDVADLHERAGNRAGAEAALRRVVADYVSQQDIIAAAKITEERLHQPEESLQMLLNAWPQFAQAIACLGAAFQLLGRMNKHDVALEHLAQVKREGAPSRLAIPLVSTLAAVAREYPHDAVRHAAADFCRVSIAQQLQRPACTSGDAAQLLQHLIQLAPHDRILSRDAHRYLADRRASDLRIRRVTPPPLPGKKLVEIRRFELPRGIQWLQLRREWLWFFVLGLTPNGLTLLRGVWEGEFQNLEWEIPPEVGRSGLIFEPTLERGKAVAFARVDGIPLQEKRFAASDLFFNQDCVVGQPSWLPSQASPIAVGEDSAWSVHVAGGRAILSSYDKRRGQLQTTVDITTELLAGAARTGDTRLCITTVDNTVAIGLGNRLVWTRGDGGLTRVELPGQAIHVVGTLPNTRRGVAVMMDHGAIIYWAGADSCMELDRDIEAPLATFIPGGPFVLASGPQLILLDVDSGGVRSVARMEMDGREAIGLSGTCNPGEVAVLYKGGLMVVYRSNV